MWCFWNTCVGATPGRTISCSSDETYENEDFVVQIGDILCSDTTRYLIRDFVDEGCFGKVASCVNLMTSQEVALKIPKIETVDSDITEKEIKMLELVSVLDPSEKNVVQFFERFEYKGHTCLVFEMLDRSLFHLLKDRHWRPLSLSELRPIALQLLTAFDALKGIDVIHSDLKPDNIMLTGQLDENFRFRVKLIDFGLSITTSEVTHGMEIQPLGYRAPEVILGLPISEAIDMWGLGCVLAFLYIGNHLFAPNCEYQMMRGIVKILGQPADYLLCAGDYTHRFFKKNQHLDNQKWWPKTPREYQLDNGIAPERWNGSLNSLGDLISSDPEMQEDERAFVSLLKCLLHVDPEKRITPEKALKHPFITMTPLMEEMETSLKEEESGPDEESAEDTPATDGSPPATDETPSAMDGSPSAAPGTNGAGSATPRSCDGITNMPHSNDGAAAAGQIDTTGTADKKSAASQSAASPAEETPATDGSPYGTPLVSDWSPMATTGTPSTIGTPSSAIGTPSVTLEIPSATLRTPLATLEIPSATLRTPSATIETPLATLGTHSAVPGTNAAGSATPRSCDGITTMPHPNDGAAADIDVTGTADEESAASQTAASPAEETLASSKSPSATDGSPDEGPPVKVKKSRLKRVRKFFGRVIKALF